MPLSAMLCIACRATGKKIKGRKRHILTDSVGLLIGVVVHSAGIQDRDGLHKCPLPSANPIHGFAMSLQTAVIPDQN